MHIILGVALVMRVVMDICFKLSVKNVSFTNASVVDGFIRVASSWAFWLAIITAGINFGLWLMVLSHYDLSFAYPLFGICFALIMISGKLFFNETLDKNKWIGIGFILMSSMVLIFG
jgi:multidrug transporter EmrE-like cation transporter